MYKTETVVHGDHLVTEDPYKQRCLLETPWMRRLVGVASDETPMTLSLRIILWAPDCDGAIDNIGSGDLHAPKRAP